MTEDRVQDLIDAGVITDHELPPITVSSEIAKKIDDWAEKKGIESPTKQMIIYNPEECQDD